MATVFTPSLGGACGPIAAFLLRHCEFTVHDEECAFCSWVGMGRSSEMRPNRDEMRETLEAIAAEQRGIGYLAFSGASLFDRTKEADAFLAYMQAARATGLHLPTTVAAIQALDRDDSLRLREAGFDYACYSMEVWSAHAWREVLPGKDRSVGRDTWMRCLEEAVDVFGPPRVLCNFVAGVEMAAAGATGDPRQGPHCQARCQYNLTHRAGRGEGGPSSLASLRSEGWNRLQTWVQAARELQASLEGPVFRDRHRGDPSAKEELSSRTGTQAMIGDSRS